MDNKVFIVLNEQQAIEKLVADPETEIRIKDAIINNIGRRAFHIFNIEKDIKNACIRQIEDEFLTGNMFTRNLKPDVAKLIKEQCEKDLSNIIDLKIKSVRRNIDERIKLLSETLEVKLKEFNFEAAINTAAEKVLREKLSH